MSGAPQVEEQGELDRHVGARQLGIFRVIRSSRARVRRPRLGGRGTRFAEARLDRFDRSSDLILSRVEPAPLGSALRSALTFSLAAEVSFFSTSSSGSASTLAEATEPAREKSRFRLLAWRAGLEADVGPWWDGDSRAMWASGDCERRRLTRRMVRTRDDDGVEGSLEAMVG